MARIEPDRYSLAGDDRNFPITRWSIVIASRGGPSDNTSEALRWLCERYWRPLLVYVCSRGYSLHDAQDLVQAFFEKLLSSPFAQHADADRGRFRSYLLGCLNHFLADGWRHDRRPKNGAGLQFISLEHTDPESLDGITDPSSPENAYDLAWAQEILERAITQLRLECDASGHTGRFEVLQSFLGGEREERSLSSAAARLNLSLAAVKSLVHRIRQRCRELIREEIAATVTRSSAVDEEMRHLRLALASR